MFNWLRRRRLSAETRRKLLIVGARSEEAIIDTHVSNALDLLDTIGDEVDLDHALDLYRELMSLSDGMAAMVTTRLLARLETPTPPRTGGPRARRHQNR